MAATLNGLDNNPAFTENGAQVVLDGDAVIVGAASYDGAVLTLARDGGANPDDVFGGSGPLTLADGQVALTELSGGEFIDVIVGTFTNADGTLIITFNANATQERVNTVLQRLTYANGSDSPPPSVTIDYLFNDGQGPATGSITIGITATNDQPTLDSVEPAAAYRPGTAGTVLSPDVTVGDPDSPTLASATVTIPDGLAGDVLSADPGNTGISVSYDPIARILTLSGVHTLAEYRQVLDTVTYSSTAADPSNGGANPTRTIQWRLNDGAAANNLSAVQTTTLHFTPTLDLDQSAAGDGFSTAFTENGAPVPIADTDTVITNPNGADLSSATIVLTNAKPGDSLTIIDPLPGGISGSVDTSVPGQITVSLNGTASPATYQAALRQVAFGSASDNPDPTPRNIAVVVGTSNEFGNEFSNTAHTTIVIAPVNDAPVNTVPGTQQARTDTDHTIAGLSVSDPDIGAGDITVTLTVENGTIHVRDDLGSGAILNNNTDTVTLQGSLASVNAILAASRGVVYRGDFNYVGADTLTMASDDGNHTGSGGPLQDIDSVAINVTARHHSITDFNPDSSDVLWQRVGDGALLDFHLNGPHLTSFGFPGSVASEWQITSAADYNGDHNTDLLFRRDDGSLLMQTFVNNQLQTQTIIGPVGNEWQVLGSSDFNGDTRDDILWQRNDGTLLIFDMNGPQITAAPIIGQIGLEWQLQGTGDYNGDGTGDMFWRAGDGRLLMFEIANNQVQKATVFGQMGNEWQVAGSGDFNGDDKTDILWQRNDGTLLIFDMNGAQIQSMVNPASPGAGWNLEGTADYNNDGTADLLWQHSGDGALLLDEMLNNQVNHATVFGQVGTEWHLL